MSKHIHLLSVNVDTCIGRDQPSRRCQVCLANVLEDEWGDHEVLEEETEEERRESRRPDPMDLARDAKVNRWLDKQGGV